MAIVFGLASYAGAVSGLHLECCAVNCRILCVPVFWSVVSGTNQLLIDWGFHPIGHNPIFLLL